MSLAPINIHDVELVIEERGDPADDTVLLVAGTSCSMDFWRPEFCEAIAGRGFHVVRFDQRDTGRAVADPPGEPRYRLPDLVDDAVGILDELKVERAHWVGFSQGGWVAQLAAIEHPARASSITLMSSRPVGHGPNDADLPEVTPAIMDAFSSSEPPPPLGDVEAWVGYLVDGERPFASRRASFDAADVEVFARATATRSRDLMSMLSNHSMAPQGDRWRERLGQITCPTFVIHGDDDPMFPLGNAEALAAEIPGARLHVLAEVGHELPIRVRHDVVEIITTFLRSSKQQ
jgi:pimeloyl-ACP methyl ester carboxylesterase